MWAAWAKKGPRLLLAKNGEEEKHLTSPPTACQNLLLSIIITMISSTESKATSSSSDDDYKIVSRSLSVVQTVKKWIRNSWPFGKIDENESDVGGEAEDHDAAVVARVAESRRDGGRQYYCDEESEHRGDGNDGRDRDYDREAAQLNKEKSACASKSKENDDGSNCNRETTDFTSTEEQSKAGSRVMDVVMASSPKLFLRNRRQRKSCRFQLDDDHATAMTDVVAKNNNINNNATTSSHHHHIGGATTNNEEADKNNIVASATRSKLQDDDAPTLLQDSCHWAQEEITALRNAYQQSNPTSTTLWHDISTVVGEKSACECQRKWFSLVATPKKRVAARRRKQAGSPANDKDNNNNEEEEEDDDIFDSTPLKHAVKEIENEFSSFQQQTNTATSTTKQQEQQQLLEDKNDTTFHSPNKKAANIMMMKSPLQKRPRMLSPKNNNNNNSGGGKNKNKILSPLINRRKGYNAYVNNLRKEIRRAQKAKKGNISDINIETRSSNNNNKSSSILVVKDGTGKSQLSAKLASNGRSTFVLNIPQDESEDNGSDVDVFDEMFRIENEDEENMSVLDLD